MQGNDDKRTEHRKRKEKKNKERLSMQNPSFPFLEVADFIMIDKILEMYVQFSLVMDSGV